MPGRRSHSQAVPSPSDPGEQSSLFSPRGAPRTLRSAPHPPNLYSHPLPAHRPQEPTGPPAQPHEGPEPDSEGFPTNSPGHVSREPYRLLGPGPTATSRTRQDLPRGGSTNSHGPVPRTLQAAQTLQPVPPYPADPHQAAVSHDQHHVDPREPVAAGPRHARPGRGRTTWRPQSRPTPTPRDQTSLNHVTRTGSPQRPAYVTCSARAAPPRPVTCWGRGRGSCQCGRTQVKLRRWRRRLRYRAAPEPVPIDSCRRPLSAWPCRLPPTRSRCVWCPGGGSEPRRRRRWAPCGLVGRAVAGGWRSARPAQVRRAGGPGAGGGVKWRPRP